MLRRLLITIILVVGLPGLALAAELATWAEISTEGNDFILTENASSESWTATTSITFNFSTLLDTGVPQGTDATLTLNASTTGDAYNNGGPGGTDGESGFTGTFTIISSWGTNLLSGNFSFGSLSGTDGGNAMTFQSADSSYHLTAVTFTSDYLNFNYYTETLALSWSMSNLKPVLSITDDFLTSNNSAGSGNFSADPLPPVVAEPETLLLSGAALLSIGLFLRKQKLRTVR